MVGGNMFKGLFEVLIGMGIIIGLIVCGIIWLLMVIFSDNEIKLETEMKYDRIELTIKENKIDTLYVYDISKY